METGIDSMSRSAVGTTMPMNRMNGALRALATQATHTSGPIGSVLTTLGMFTVGAGPVAIALIAIAAVAKGYDLLTSKARAAAKEQKSLADSLGQMFKPSTGPDSDKARAFNAALQERIRIAKEMQDVENAPISSPGFKERRLAALAAEYQRLGKFIGQAMMVGAGELDTVNIKTEKATSAIAKMSEAVQEMGFSWRRAMMNVEDFSETIEKITLRDAAAMMAEKGAKIFNPRAGDRVQVDATGVGPGMAIDDRIQEMIDKSERQAKANQDAIWGAAIQSARIITNALNIGGGGRNSGLGGALGSTAGFAAGFVFGGGPVGGAIGSTIGGLLGSAIGGLFDSNTRATNANTEATRALTEAMLNAPSGYKTAGARFDATEIRTSHQRYLTRGGTPILGAA